MLVDGNRGVGRVGRDIRLDWPNDPHTVIVAADDRVVVDREAGHTRDGTPNHDPGCLRIAGVRIAEAVVETDPVAGDPVPVDILIRRVTVDGDPGEAISG